MLELLELAYQSVTTVAFNHSQGNEAFIVQECEADYLKSKAIQKNIIRMFDCLDLSGQYQGSVIQTEGGKATFVRHDLKQIAIEDITFI